MKQILPFLLVGAGLYFIPRKAIAKNGGISYTSPTGEFSSFNEGDIIGDVIPQLLVPRDKRSKSWVAIRTKEGKVIDLPRTGVQIKIDI